MTHERHATVTLDSVLRMIDVQGAVFVRSDFSAPWGISIAADGMTFFHVVTQGRCWLSVEGNPSPVQLEAGDLVIMPHGTLHRLQDDLSTPTPTMQEVFSTHALDGNGALTCGGGGELTKMVCGEFRFADRSTDPLLFALPSYIRVRGHDGEAAPWLKATLRWVAEETTANTPGAETVVTRLTDILFIQAVRAAFDSTSIEQLGWLRGLKDERVAHALFLIHQQPEQAWSVEGLARIAGASRSWLAGRFTELVGESPMRYLARWRLNRAASLLRTTEMSVAEIAVAVGYDSEVGFSKAFKRHTGTAPGRYRDQADPSSSPSAQD